MLLNKERQFIKEYGLKLLEMDLTSGTGGNLSIYNRKKKLMAISPSAIPYKDIDIDDIVIMNLEGEKIEGKQKPSTEFQLHRIIYKNRKDVNAVIHTHPIYTTTIACLNEEIPSVHYLVAYSGYKVPCAKYAAFGSEKLAKNVYKAMGNKYNASLMANHGLITVGEDIKKALIVTEMVEYCAELYYRTKNQGEPNILSRKQMKRVINKFEDY
ncbi:MAG: L-fuculose-phosphate aldolase [Nanoarchaeota archaeon]